MTGPSNFDDKQPGSKQSNPDRPGGREGVGIWTYAGQILLLLFTVGCGLTFVVWLVNDASGEYRGQSNELGRVTISLVRHAANVSGQLTVGDQKPLPMTDGDISHKDQIQLTFRANNGTNKLNYAVVAGKIVDGTLKGSLKAGGGTYKITLQRDALSSMFRQIQEYLPFAS